MQPIAHATLFSPWEPGVFSLILYGVLVCALVAGLLVLSARLGERKPHPEKLRAYESGVIPTGSARLAQPVPFYLVAIFFLVFDVEAVVIVAWAIACDRLGWPGWWQVVVFIGILMLSLLYLWKKGGLEWGPKATAPANARRTLS